MKVLSIFSLLISLAALLFSVYLLIVPDLYGGKIKFCGLAFLFVSIYFLCFSIIAISFSFRKRKE